MRIPLIYIDIDGVLIRYNDNIIWDSGCPGEIANDAVKFLTWASTFFRPIWLTARSKTGNIAPIIEALRVAFAPLELLDIAKEIPVQSWTRTKTDGINFSESFFWVDDNPSSDDLLALERHGCRERWIEVNSDLNPDDLMLAMSKINIDNNGRCDGYIKNS